MTPRSRVTPVKVSSRSGVMGGTEVRAPGSWGVRSAATSLHPPRRGSGRLGFKAQPSAFCPGQRRRCLGARDWRRNTLDCSGAHGACQVLRPAFPELPSGEAVAGSPPPPPDLTRLQQGWVGQGLSLRTSALPICRSFRVSDPGPSASAAASHLFGLLHAPRDHSDPR